jgi:ABC-2 type transport system permease protein
MTLFIHILHFKLLSYVHSAFEARPVSIIRGIGSLLVFGGFAFGAYVLANGTTQFILENTHTGLYLYHQFISMMLFVFFVAVNLGNIIVSYSTLYRSNEVQLLLTKPIPFTTIFILKFLDNFFYSSATLFLVAFMVLLGYGHYFGHPWYFYAGVMFFVLVPFMFLSACLAAMVLMAIMKLAGKLGFRRVMAGLFTIYFIFIYLFFRASNPIHLVETVNRYYPLVDGYLAQLTPGFLEYLPNQWVADFLFYTASGRLLDALPSALTILGTTAVAFGICVLIARRFYYRSWLISLHVQAAGQMPRDPGKVAWIDFRSGPFLSRQLDVLLKKEFFAFFREPSQWIHFIVMIILMALFSFSVGTLNFSARVRDIQFAMYIVLFAFGGFMVSSLALRFSFPMIGLEGKAFWALRSSPIKMEKIFFVKFLLVLFVVLLMAEFIAVSSNIPFVRMTAARPLLLWFGIFSAGWISIATVSINLGLGGYFADYSEKNPIRAASTQGATLTFLLSLLYLIALLVITIVPLSLYFESLIHFHQFQMSSIIVPGTLLGMVSYLLSAFGIIAGLRSMRRDF